MLLQVRGQLWEQFVKVFMWWPILKTRSIIVKWENKPTHLELPNHLLQTVHAVGGKIFAHHGFSGCPCLTILQCVGFRTGTGIPAVFPKWVLQVWVW
jgi:hypothetical protein